MFLRQTVSLCILSINFSAQRTRSARQAAEEFLVTMEPHSAACALSWRIFAQTATVAPLRTFDLQLERRAGRGASIAGFVARNSHLYFAVSHPSGYLELQTTPDGSVLHTASIGAEEVSGFDVDATGNSWLLHGGFRVTEFDREGEFKRTLNLESPIVSFAVVGGRPMGVGQDGELRFLDKPGGGFTLEAYPPPWLLFPIEPDRLGILRPEVPTLQVLRLEEGLSTVRLASASTPIAAAADEESRIYLLGLRGNTASASVIECDDNAIPRFMFDFELPAAFDPRMIGIMDERVYLVDRAGKVAVYPPGAEPHIGHAVDQSPELLTDLAPIYSVARTAGYSGRVAIRLEVSEKGVPEHPRVLSPAMLGNIPDVMDAIGAWRFRPAVRSGKNTAVPMEVNIDVF